MISDGFSDHVSLYKMVAKAVTYTGMPEIVLTLFCLDFVDFPFVVAKNVINIF